MLCATPYIAMRPCDTQAKLLDRTGTKGNFNGAGFALAHVELDVEWCTLFGLETPQARGHGTKHAKRIDIVFGVLNGLLTIPLALVQENLAADGPGFDLLVARDAQVAKWRQLARLQRKRHRRFMAVEIDLGLRHDFGPRVSGAVHECQQLGLALVKRFFRDGLI